MPATFEYLLPVDHSTLRSEHLALLTPWFERLSRKTSEEITPLLSHEWRGGSQLMATVASFYLTLRPTSIVFNDGKVWLLLSSRGGDTKFIIHEPRKLRPQQIAFLNRASLSSLESFCAHFYEVFEDVKPYANALVMQPEPIARSFFPGIGEWEGGLWLYYIRSGDAIVISPKGAIGIWKHDQCEVLPVEWTLEEFVGRYVACMKEPQSRRTTLFR